MGSPNNLGCTRLSYRKQWEVQISLAVPDLAIGSSGKSKYPWVYCADVTQGMYDLQALLAVHITFHIGIIF